jgi:predicted nuclease of predicted toxin-antitoxin system
MKFLLDVGISPQLGQLIEGRGHSFRYLPVYFSSKTSDHEILNIAAEAGEVIITHDLDFGKLLAFSGQNQPSVILFRIHHISAQIFYELILKAWDFIAEPLHTGALVVIESESVRVRMLPI